MALDKDAHFIGSASRPMRHWVPISAISAPSFPPSPAARCWSAFTNTATYVNVKGVMTNTVPTDAYRGAGRPERPICWSASSTTCARDRPRARRIRARNFVKPSQIPWKTALGDTYHSAISRPSCAGHGQGRLEGLPVRRAASQARGKWRGIGMATYVEKCGGGGAPETAIAKFNDDASVTLYLGNQTTARPRDGDPADRLGGWASMPSASTSCRAIRTSRLRA